MTARRRATRLRVVHRTSSSAEDELVSLTVLAREAGVSTASAARFIALGLLEPRQGPGRPLFSRIQASCLASAERLRHDLGLNHAGAVLTFQLLCRIEELEARLEGLRRDRPDV
jgi:hypothetical protein